MATLVGDGRLNDEELLALTELVVMVALVDGHFSVKEYSTLVTRLCSLEPSLTADQVNLLIDQVDVPQKASPEYRQERLEALAQTLKSPAARHRAMEVAVEIARSHDGIGRRESAFLVRSAEVLGFLAADAVALLKK